MGIPSGLGIYEIQAGLSSKQENIPAYERKQIIGQPDKEVKSAAEQLPWENQGKSS